MKCKHCKLRMKKDRISGTMRCENQKCSNAGVAYRLPKLDRRARVLDDAEESTVS